MKISYLQESFSTRATSIGCRTISTDSQVSRPQGYQQVHYESVLKPIPENDLDYSSGAVSPHKQSRCSQGSLSETLEVVEQLRQDVVILRGHFVIGIRDQQQIQHINRCHSQFLNSLLKNYVPVIYLSDLENLNMKSSIPIVLDYLDKQEPFKHYDLLSTQNNNIRLQRKSSSLSYNKMDIISCRVTRSAGYKIIKLPNYRDKNLPTFKKPIFTNQFKLNNFTTFGSQQNYVNKNQLISTAFSSSHQAIILILTYHKMYKRHSHFLQEVFKYYSTQPTYQICKQIVRYLSIWLGLYLVDDEELGLLQRFIDKSILHNFWVSKKLNFLLTNLQQTLLKTVVRTNNYEESNQQLGVQYLQKSQSSHVQVERVEYYAHQIRLSQSSKFQVELVEYCSKQCLKSSNINWMMYIDVPTQVLQKQLCLVDVILCSLIFIQIQLYQDISISDLLSRDGLQQSKQRNQLPPQFIKQRALTRAANHFNMLQYHMLYAVIMCPGQLLSILFSKLAHLSWLAVQAHHYQLAYMLQCFFVHDIAHSYLDPAQHLSLISQQQLAQLSKLSRKKPQSEECLPCLSWVQSELNKVEVSSALYVEIEGEQYVNFAKLEQIARIINPLIQLQRRTCELKKEQPYYDFFSMQYREQLISNLNCDNQCKIEIELYKLRKSSKQKAY